MKTSNINAYVRKRRYQVAIHEAGHAVVAHLVGIAIDHVRVNADYSGISVPVRDPVAAAGDKLWAESVAISRKLVWGRLTESFTSKEVWLLRKGSRLRYWRWDGRAVKPSSRTATACNAATRHGTPAPELGKRVEDLRKQACAAWKRASASQSKDDHIKNLMHTLGGPVADSVFFGFPFAPPRNRPLTKAEIKEHRERLCARLPYLATNPELLPNPAHWTKAVGNAGASSDFRHIRETLKRIDEANWKETREHYRAKVEKLVRQHKTAIERVGKALLKRKRLSGAEVAELIRICG